MRDEGGRGRPRAHETQEAASSFGLPPHESRHEILAYAFFKFLKNTGGKDGRGKEFEKCSATGGSEGGEVEVEVVEDGGEGGSGAGPLLPARPDELRHGLVGRAAAVRRRWIIVAPLRGGTEVRTSGHE